MIHVIGENLVDPIEWVRANIDELDLPCENYKPTTILGKDLDVQIYAIDPDGPVKALKSTVEPQFKHLYEDASADFREGRFLYHIYWVSSADARNALTEELGYKPGIDMLRVVRAAETDRIIVRKFVEYRQRLEYPEANEGGYFVHDKTSPDHMPSIWKTPPRWMRLGTVLAQQAMAAGEGNCEEVMYAAGALDRMSEAINGSSKTLINSNLTGFSLSDLVRTGLRASNLTEEGRVVSYFFNLLMPGKVGRNYDRQQSLDLCAEFIEHNAEVAKRAKVLQFKRATGAATALTGLRVDYEADEAA